MTLSMTIATPDNAAEIVFLRNEAANLLTSQHGNGHWSYQTSEKGVINGMNGNSKVLIAKHGNEIAGTLRLATKKPWAIDPAYFTKVPQALYLVDMAVRTDLQRKGVGKFMLHEVKPFVTEWPAQAIRLDAYSNAAGAGEFYNKCGFTEKGRIIYRAVPLIYFELVYQAFSTNVK